MKKSILFAMIWLLSLSVFAKTSIVINPHIKDYYEGTQDLEGKELFNKLQEIVTKNHRSRSYGALYDKLAKAYADDRGEILDYYSDNPFGNDPYTYTSRDKCGNYKGEGDCFNREHLFPQSIFNKRRPMRTDFHHIIPTDGYVNNRRSSFPFGEVGHIKWESQNGSKVGDAENSDYHGVVFEPIDEYKGDIARALFYFAVRYQKVGGHWRNVTLNNSNHLFYQIWYIKTLKRWHKEDPVNPADIERNSKGQEFQKNRNPFIDHPEWVELIW